MTPEPNATDFRRTALAAGLAYLVIIVLGVSSEALVRGALVVPDDARQTAQNILDHEMLFRLSLAADSVMAIADIALAVLLFVLLRPVSPLLAAMAAAFRLAQMAIVGGNLLNQQAALLVLTDDGAQAALGGSGVQALALQAMELHSHGYDLGLIFFGISSLLVGYLLFRSADFPRLLGAMMAAAGVVYLTGSYLRFLAPDAATVFAPAYAVPLLAESAFCLWLILAAGRGSALGRPGPVAGTHAT